MERNQLIKAIKLLNDATNTDTGEPLLKNKIKFVAKKEEEMIKSFLDACNKIPEEQEDYVPDEVADVYNALQKNAEGEDPGQEGEGGDESQSEQEEPEAVNESDKEEAPTKSKKGEKEKMEKKNGKEASKATAKATSKTSGKPAAKPAAKPAKPSSENMNEFGFRINTAGDEASKLLAAGRKVETVISALVKKFGKSEAIAAGRVKKTIVTMKKRGFLK